MVASPKRSAFAIAIPPASDESLRDGKITSSVRAEMAWRCEAYRLEERMRSDLGRRRRCARGMAAMGLPRPPSSGGISDAVIGGDGEVVER